MAALISFTCGLISLGGEILWVRLFGFANESTPKAFGFVLFCYLIGIALGAEYGKKACKNKENQALISRIAFIYLISSASWIAFPFIYGMAMHTPAHLPAAAILIILSAAIIAYVFPIAHHIGANSEKNQGKKFSKVYVSNVIGAGLGPLIIGWYFLDIFSLHQCFILLSIVSAIFAASLIINNKKQPIYPIALLITAAFTWENSNNWLIQNTSARLDTIKYINENKHGIITIFEGGTNGDIVFGGNVYDGRTNLNGDINSNGLHRVLVAGMIQRKPQRVLMIGLSIGSWLALVREFHQVDSIDIIEINPGYAKLAANYKLQADALNDPRVHIFFDDARRWLRLHPEKKYDLIIMNNTWNWRAYSSLLLSIDFFSQLKTHMSEESLLAFNSTYSQDAFFTAQNVFNHTYRLSNFIYASSQPLIEKFNRKDNIYWLQDFRIQGERVFSENSQMPKHITEMSFINYENARKGLERESEKITDDNMLTEFKYGKPLF